MSIKELTWIGDISYAQPQGKGEYPGAVCMSFNSIKTYNKYFKDHPNLLVIDDHYIPRFFGLFGTSVVAMVTNQLNEEEMNDLQEVARETEFKMAEIRKKRAIAKEEQTRKAEADKVEEKRLADVGRRYEARVSHMKALPSGDPKRKELEATLNRGDVEVLGITNKQDSANYNGAK